MADLLDRLKAALADHYARSASGSRRNVEILLSYS